MPPRSARAATVAPARTSAKKSSLAGRTSSQLSTSAPAVAAAGAASAEELRLLPLLCHSFPTLRTVPQRPSREQPLPPSRLLGCPVDAPVGIGRLPQSMANRCIIEQTSECRTLSRHHCDIVFPRRGSASFLPRAQMFTGPQRGGSAILQYHLAAGTPEALSPEAWAAGNATLYRSLRSPHLLLGKEPTAALHSRLIALNPGVRVFLHPSVAEEFYPRMARLFGCQARVCLPESAAAEDEADVNYVGVEQPLFARPPATAVGRVRHEMTLGETKAEQRAVLLRKKMLLVPAELAATGPHPSTESARVLPRPTATFVDEIGMAAASTASATAPRVKESQVRPIDVMVVSAELADGGVDAIDGHALLGVCMGCSFVRAAWLDLVLARRGAAQPEVPACASAEMRAESIRSLGAGRAATAEVFEVPDPGDPQWAAAKVKRLAGASQPAEDEEDEAHMLERAMANPKRIGGELAKAYFQRAGELTRIAVRMLGGEVHTAVATLRAKTHWASQIRLTVLRAALGRPESSLAGGGDGVASDDSDDLRPVKIARHTARQTESQAQTMRVSLVPSPPLQVDQGETAPDGGDSGATKDALASARASGAADAANHMPSIDQLLGVAGGELMRREGEAAVSAPVDPVALLLATDLGVCRMTTTGEALPAAAAGAAASAAATRTPAVDRANLPGSLVRHGPPRLPLKKPILVDVMRTAMT